MARHLWLLVALSLSVAFSGSGCGTLQTAGAGIRAPYAGTKLDGWIEGNFPSDRAAAWLDWPLSFALDTALLPVAILTHEDTW